MKKITVIQSSLRQGSNTAIVARKFAEKCDALGMHVHYVDLRDVKMELCDARQLEDYPADMQKVYDIMQNSEAVIFGMPVYQYSMSGVLKNFIDICGGSLKEKKIGVLVNAGGPNCYMASRDIFDCLFYEYGTTNVAPMVYSWSMDFENGEIKNTKVLEKIDELAHKLLTL